MYQCGGAVYTVPFVNFTFKDELTNTDMTAYVDSSTFTYWATDVTLNKTLVFSNTTAVNPSYAFCFPAGQTPVYMNTIFKYSNTSYPQRTWTYSNTLFTNITTNKTLYLLGSTVGQYVAFQLLNAGGETISGVKVNVTKSVLGTTTLVEQGITGDDGVVTFWLDPNYVHTITASKTGYTTASYSITPTQTSYTITLGGTDSNTTTTDYARGISYSIYPSDKYLLNQTSYDFKFILSSNYWTVSSFGFVLTNGSNSIGTTSNTTNGGTLTLTKNTGLNSTIQMDYYYVVNSTYYNFTVYWKVFDSSKSNYGLKTFVSHIQNYTQGSGMFGMKLNDFSWALIIFVVIFIVTGIMSYTYGLTNPATITFIIFALVGLLDVGLGLIPNPIPSTTLNNFPTVFMFIIFMFFLVKELQNG